MNYSISQRVSFSRYIFIIYLEILDYRWASVPGSGGRGVVCAVRFSGQTSPSSYFDPPGHLVQMLLLTILSILLVLDQVHLLSVFLLLFLLLLLRLLLTVHRLLLLC